MFHRFRFLADPEDSGSNVIPRRARPGLAGLRPHKPQTPASRRVTRYQNPEMFLRLLADEQTIPIAQVPVLFVCPHRVVLITFKSDASVLIPIQTSLSNLAKIAEDTYRSRVTRYQNPEMFLRLLADEQTIPIAQVPVLFPAPGCQLLKGISTTRWAQTA